MNKYLLIFSAFVSLPSFAMTNDCKIAVEMFKESGTLITLATEKATGPNATKLSESKVTSAEFNDWEKRVFNPKMSNLINKYAPYQAVSQNNPIYLGNVLLLETSNYNDALSKYIETKESSYISLLKETMARIGNANESLKNHCSK